MSSKAQALKISTSDGVEFTVSSKVINQSKLLTDVLQIYQQDTDVLPLSKVDAKTFEKVIEYCEHHEDDEWDSEIFIVDQKTLIDLVLAAGYLEIQGLLDFTRELLARKIRNKSASEIRTYFELSDGELNAEGKSDN